MKPPMEGNIGFCQIFQQNRRNHVRGFPGPTGDPGPTVSMAALQSKF